MAQWCVALGDKCAGYFVDCEDSRVLVTSLISYGTASICLVLCSLTSLYTLLLSSSSAAPPTTSSSPSSGSALTPAWGQLSLLCLPFQGIKLLSSYWKAEVSGCCCILSHVKGVMVHLRRIGPLWDPKRHLSVDCETSAPTHSYTCWKWE